MIQMNLELIRAEAPLKRLRASGGLSKLDGLCQKLSNLSGLELERSNVVEATARGAAWLAAGRPQHWNPAAADKDTAGDAFVPQPDQALQARYETFKLAMQRVLEQDCRAGVES